jgi:hypothetical protein
MTFDESICINKQSLEKIEYTKQDASGNLFSTIIQLHTYLKLEMACSKQVICQH